MRFSSAIENFRFSVGCVTHAIPEFIPPAAVTVGDGSAASARTRLKYFSDCSPGFSLSHSRPIACREMSVSRST